MNWTTALRLGDAAVEGQALTRQSATASRPTSGIRGQAVWCVLMRQSVAEPPPPAVAYSDLQSYLSG